MRRTTYTLLAVALMILTTNANAQNIGKTTDTLLSYYNQLLEFNGNALIANKGKVTLNKGYGYRIVEKEMPCDTNTYFQIGAITQTFTATVVLMLHEQKQLNINDKLSKYFPNYPNGNKITIEHLLTHTSGIYNYTDSAEFMQIGLMTPLSQELMMNLFEHKSLAFKPGTQYDKCNSGYILLGYIIEKVTGKTYFDATKSMILDSLGMDHTGFSFNTFPSWDKAQGHYIMRYGRLMPAPLVDSTISFAATSMFTTTADLYKWTQAVIDQRFLSPQMWKKALTPYKSNYGYGWQIDEDTLIKKKIISHYGKMPGFVANLQIVPEDKTAILLLSNDMGDDPKPILRDIKAILYNKPFTYPQPRQPLKLPEAKLREYEGMYALTKTTSLRLYYDQQLLKGLILGQEPFILFAEKEDYFFLGNVDTKIRFVRDKSNKVISLKILQQGEEKEAKKWR